MPELTQTQLIQKITKAQVKLEAFRTKYKKRHPLTCPIEDDTSYAPCNCGAEEHNSAIDSIIKELSLD
jgi:hypothetical protein